MDQECIAKMLKEYCHPVAKDLQVKISNNSKIMQKMHTSNLMVAQFGGHDIDLQNHPQLSHYYNPI